MTLVQKFAILFQIRQENAFLLRTLALSTTVESIRYGCAFVSRLFSSEEYLNQYQFCVTCLFQLKCRFSLND